MTTYTTHPVADALPMMSPEERATLIASMQRKGWDPDEPAVLYDGQVLDGRNRLSVAVELELDPIYTDMTEEIEDPVEWVASKNLARRSLSQSQRAVVAVAFMPELMRQAEARQKAGKPAEDGKRSRAFASELTGASERLIQEAMRLDEERLALVRAGQLTVISAVRAMGLGADTPPTHPSETQEPSELAGSDTGQGQPAEPEEPRVTVADIMAAAEQLGDYDQGLVVTRLRQQIQSNKGPGADTDSWCTPPEVRDPVREFFEDLDCDLATNEHGIMGATVGYTAEDDCFTQDLTPHKTLWLNPWYSDPGPPMELLADAIAARVHEAEGLCLPKGDWSTEWWLEQVIKRAAAICYWAKRVAFLHEGKKQTTATFPIAMVYYGSDPARFSDRFAAHGDIRILRSESV